MQVSKPGEYELSLDRAPTDPELKVTIRAQGLKLLTVLIIHF